MRPSVASLVAAAVALGAPGPARAFGVRCDPPALVLGSGAAARIDVDTDGDVAPRITVSAGRVENVGVAADASRPTTSRPASRTRRSRSSRPWRAGRGGGPPCRSPATVSPWRGPRRGPIRCGWGRRLRAGARGRERRGAGARDRAAGRRRRVPPRPAAAPPRAPERARVRRARARRRPGGRGAGRPGPGVRGHAGRRAAEGAPVELTVTEGRVTDLAEVAPGEGPGAGGSPRAPRPG